MIFLSVFTVFLRLTFLPVIGVMLMYSLFTDKDPGAFPSTNWSVLITHLSVKLSSVVFFGILSSLTCLVLFFIVDSSWYGYPTLAFLNNLKYYILRYTFDRLNCITTVSEILLEINVSSVAHAMRVLFTFSRDHRYVSGSWLKYFDCFLRDNNVFVFLGTLLALSMQPKSRGYCAPYVSTVIHYRW
jgi:hypothetical protein